MEETVELGNIEMLSAPKFHKNILLLIEVSNRVIEVTDGIGGVRWKLGKIKEVKEGTHCPKKASWQTSMQKG